MKILQLHCLYTSSKISGENIYVERLRDLLADVAHVDNIVFSTQELTSDTASKGKAMHVGASFLFGSNRMVIKRAAEYDLIILHNQIPYISARTIEELLSIKPVLRVWHNVRNLCIEGGFFRDGANCFKCRDGLLGRSAGIIHRCYRGNMAQSLLVTQNQRKNYKLFDHENYFHVAISDYILDQMNFLGIPKKQILKIPNFSENSNLALSQGTDFIYVGRLENQKGWRELLAAWGNVPANLRKNKNLHIVGEGFGKETDLSEFNESDLSGVIFHGRLDHFEIFNLMRKCRTQIIPSQWEEPFGTVAIEGMSLGLRLIVTPSGGLGEFSRCPGVLVTRNKSVQAISDSILIDIQNNRDFSAEIRDYWAKNFSSQIVKKIWIEQLSKLILNY